MSLIRKTLGVSLAAVGVAGLGLGQEVLRHEASSVPVDDVALTPNGARVLVRDRSTQLRVYRTNGQLETTLQTSVPSAEPGRIRTTDTLAVVGGDTVDLADFTTTSPSITSPWVVPGGSAEVVQTPDRSLTAVRGKVNGLLMIRMLDGNLLLPDFSLNPGFGRRSTALTDDYAVAVSTGSPSTCTTCTSRVHVYRLRTGLQLAPTLIFETGTGVADLNGLPHDVSFTPDGTRALVRTRGEVLLLAMDPSTPTVVRRWTVSAGGGDLDKMVVTDTVAFCASTLPGAPGPDNTQLDAFDFATGQQDTAVLPGDPRDLQTTPDGTRAVLQTGSCVHLYSLGTASLSTALLDSTACAQGLESAALRSLHVGDEFLVGIDRLAQVGARLRFYDLRAGSLTPVARQRSACRPVDARLTPDGSRLVLTGNARVTVWHVATGALLLDDPVAGYAEDDDWQVYGRGLVVDDRRAVAFSNTDEPGQTGGWFTLLDVERLGSTYCATNANSTGKPCLMDAGGTTSVSANDLQVFATSAPAHVPGIFCYGVTPIQFAVGDGFLCVGAAFDLPVVYTNAAGAARYEMDFANPPTPPALITPGTTWHFQFRFRDPFLGGTGFNWSDALTLTFAP